MRHELDGRSAPTRGTSVRSVPGLIDPPAAGADAALLRTGFLPTSAPTIRWQRAVARRTLFRRRVQKLALVRQNIHSLPLVGTSCSSRRSGGLRTDSDRSDLRSEMGADHPNRMAVARAAGWMVAGSRSVLDR